MMYDFGYIHFVEVTVFIDLIDQKHSYVVQ